VWLGGNVCVLPGVTIGDNCVIGAGSVVNKDIPANSVAVGNPCKVIKQIHETV
jgi:Acetyltransferase (isoleucine patch superfamily)